MMLWLVAFAVALALDIDPEVAAVRSLEASESSPLRLLGIVIGAPLMDDPFDGIGIGIGVICCAVSVVLAADTAAATRTTLAKKVVEDTSCMVVGSRVWV
ncbi:hypothetical protein PYCC9005_000131 [Savitreella phatthalungensis]